MIVNENLYDGKNIIIKPQNKTHNFWRITIPNDLIDGEVYVFHAKVKQTDNGSGKCGFSIRKEGYPNTAWTSLPIDNFIYKFKYNSITQNSILVYSDIQERTNNVGAEFAMIKLEKGDQATPYIPSKNSLDPSKQAIFKAGGVFQEVYPL